MADIDQHSINASQQKLLFLIKRRGALGAGETAAQLKITSMGARQHLEQLEEKGYLVHQFVTQGKGRPKKQWRLTDKAAALFPDGHSALIVNLLDHLKAQVGESALDQLIQSREKEMLQTYSAKLQGISDVKARLNKLATIRSDEGYMAEVLTIDETYYLVENHCPICAAAQQCQQFCRSELEIFRAVLGCEVERTDYILDGARRCAYKIGPQR